MRILILLGIILTATSCACGRSGAAEEEESTERTPPAATISGEITPATVVEGDPCSVERISNGVRITCGDTSAELYDGAAGVPGPPGPPGRDGADGAAGEAGEPTSPTPAASPTCYFQRVPEKCGNYELWLVCSGVREYIGTRVGASSSGRCTKKEEKHD